MSYNVKPAGGITGEENEVVIIDRNWSYITIPSHVDDILTFAVIICMECGSNSGDKVRKKLIVPNVKNHEDAYAKAKFQHRLSGEWSSQVGVSLFKPNVEFKVPRTWKECDVQYLNHERWDN